jgi:hypothetical protein
VQRRQAATVNRRLAALRKFFLWAQATGRIAELATATVKGVPSTPRAPKSLPKRDVDRLIREAQKSNKRNLAIVQLLRHTGLRVGELCSLRKSGLEEGVDMGPVISAAAKERILKAIARGKADGAALLVGGGIVVGVFESGLLAGRLRVHGVYTPTAPKMGPLVGTAVFAIPRRAVVRRDHDSLILNTTLHAVRARWLMHVALKKGA